MQTLSRNLAIAISCVFVAACWDSLGEPDPLLGDWNASDGTQWAASAYFGHEHCDTQDVMELRLSGFERTRSDRSYLRDPRGVLQRSQGLNLDPLMTDVQLPPDAIDLHLNKGNAHLFLEHDESAVYVVRGDYVESWPGFPHAYGCD